MNARTLTYAKWHERLVAYLIDQFIAMAIAVLSVTICINLGLVEMKGTPDAPVIDQSSFVVVFLSLIAYHVLSTSSRWQCTPGQRLMNIRIMRTERLPITRQFALERFLAFIMPSLPIYLSFMPEKIGEALVISLSIFWYTPILYTPERTGLHDSLCNTRVIAGRN